MNRKDFEKWANKEFYGGMVDIAEDRARAGGYLDFAHDMAWGAWQFMAKEFADSLEKLKGKYEQH